MTAKFIYDEKTSSLYAPDGTFLKKVFCPKAKHWNQLIVEDGEDRWRGCSECGERVINLDVIDVEAAIARLARKEADEDDIPFDEIPESWLHVCVHASTQSGRVIFLEDREAIPPIEKSASRRSGAPVILTARTISDINRAASMGYWPDVRMLEYDTSSLDAKLTIGQHEATGMIEISRDYRMAYGLKRRIPSYYSEEEETEVNKWKEIIPFTRYYPHYQPLPIAAYLIPNDLPDGTEVIVKDPIEDIVGAVWNQGDNIKAENVPGYISGRKVILRPEKVRVSHLVG